MTQSDIGIVEKLTMQRPTHVGWNAEGGEVIRYHPINPDGPEAAVIIMEMVEALERDRQWFHGYISNGGKHADDELSAIDTLLAKVSGK